MSKATEQGPTAQHLTYDDIQRLVGDVDDSVIAAILSTGATYSEIEQALKWAGAGVEPPRLNAQGMTPRAELVFDILLASVEDEDED
jgi:hypothetical protein